MRLRFGLQTITYLFCEDSSAGRPFASKSFCIFFFGGGQIFVSWLPTNGILRPSNVRTYFSFSPAKFN